LAIIAANQTSPAMTMASRTISPRRKAMANPLQEVGSV
jgi:hypothetical protein